MPKRTIMTINRKTATGFILLLLTISLLIIFTVRRQTFGINTYKSGNGWGYDVLIKNKVYIHQPFMPVVQGDIPFEKRSYARKTAKIAAGKLRKNKLPTITKEELRSVTGKPLP